MIRALIFDFDGLILDTESPDYHSWAEIYREHGCELPLATWAVCIGGNGEGFDPYAHLEGQIGRDVDREQIRARRRARNRELIAANPVLPGVITWLTDARSMGLRLAVASSSPRAWVAGHLARLGLLARFDRIVCADDVTRVKPAPDLYRTSLQRLRVRPEHAIAFEDSRNGLLAATAAGIRCVAVPNPMTRHLVFAEAHRVLRSLADLTLAALFEEMKAANRTADREAWEAESQ